MRNIFLLMIVFSLVACAKRYDTPSGKPETCIPTNDVVQLSDFIANDFLSTGYTIVKHSPNQVMVQKVAGKTNWLGATPYQRATIDIIPSSGCTRVAVDFNLVHKRGMQQESTSLNSLDSVQLYFNKLNAHYHSK